jgi:hypothetical protein
VLESRSVSYGRATSYLPVIDLLTSYFQIEAHDGPQRMQEKVTGKLLGVDEVLQQTLPAPTYRPRIGWIGMSEDRWSSGISRLIAAYSA